MRKPPKARDDLVVPFGGDNRLRVPYDARIILWVSAHV
jgi:hypothetical protein